MPARRSGDPIVEKQVLAWAEWRPDPKLFLKGKFDLISVPGGKSPDRVWTLFDALDKSATPVLPFKPVHRLNAFLEDAIHDWNWVKARAAPWEDKLKYYTRVMDQSCWLLLEYFK